jgi:hypothetical protein
VYRNNKLINSSSSWYVPISTIGGSLLTFPNSTKRYYDFGWRVRLPGNGQAAMTFQITFNSFSSKTNSTTLLPSVRQVVNVVGSKVCTP